jgi:putative ABC transport system substrate-binding protein
MGIMNFVKNIRLIIIVLMLAFMPYNGALASSIGVIMTGDTPYYQAIHAAFIENIGKEDHEIVLQKPMPDPMSWTNAARKLITIGSDVIVAYGVPATLTTMKATSDIPIVFAGVYDPGAMQMTGKNATGISSKVSVKTVLDKINVISKPSKIGIILSKAEKDTILQTKEIKKNEAAMGFTSVLFSIKSKVNKEKIQGVNAIFITTCSSGMLKVKDIVEIARRDKILTAALMGGGESEGVLLTVTVNPQEQGKELAGMVKKVIGGAKPSELPVKKPTQVDVIVNLKEAKAIGLDIPEGVMNVATKVIE